MNRLHQRRKLFWLLGLVLVLLLAGGLPIASAQGTLYVAVRHITGFPGVIASVSVADTNGRALRGLVPSEFFVNEDGQALATFAVQEIERQEPISVALAVDTSGSMNGQPLTDVKKAGLDFVVSLEPKDQVALFTFDAQVNLLAPFTDTHGSLLTAVDAMQALPPGTGSTLLYQAAYDAISQVAVEGTLGHRLVLLLTDGEDVDSEVTLDEVIALAQREAVPVFVVVIDRGNAGLITKMERLTTLTGGMLYVVSGDDTADLSDQFAAIADLLKWQYEITYVSALPADGQWHTLGVKVCRGGICSNSSERRFLAAPPGGIPTPGPTITPPPAPQTVELRVIVYVDANGNGSQQPELGYEPEEGIAGVNIRITDPRTNETVLQIKTNEVGSASFRTFLDTDQRLSIYYMGFLTELRAGRPPTGQLVFRIAPIVVPGAIP